MEPREVLDVLLRYRRWVVVVFLVTVVGTLVAVKAMKPVYEASAKIMIVQTDHTLANLFSERNDNGEQDTYARDSNPINTNSELLKVLPLVKQTIREENLKDRRSGQLLDPEKLMTRIKVAPLKGTDLIQISYQHTDRELATRLVNGLVQRFARDNILHAKEQANETLRFVEQQIATVKQALDDNDRQLEQFKTANRTLDINTEEVNATQEMNRLEGYSRDNAVAIKEGSGRVGLLRQKLRLTPDEALTDVAISSHPTIRRLEAQLVETETNPLLTSGLGPQHPEIKALRAQISRLQDAVSDEAKLIAGRKMALLAKQGTLDPMREQLARDLLEEQVAVVAAEVRQRGLDAQLDAFANHVGQLPRVEVALARLTRDRQFNTDLYTLLLKRREQVKIAVAMSIGNVRIVQPAELPKQPVKPNLKQAAIAAVLMGTMLAGGAALGLEHFDDTLRNEGRAREVLDEVPITGRIPARRHLDPKGKIRVEAPPKRRKRKRKGKRGTPRRTGAPTPRPLVPGGPEPVAPGPGVAPGFKPAKTAPLVAPGVATATVPRASDGSDEPLISKAGNAALSDAYGLLRLDMVRRLGPQFKLLLTAINEPELTYYAANIALSFAHSGRRVLLVDGDMRSPSLQKYFDADSDLGLRDLLSGDATWEDVATKIPGLPLWFIQAHEGGDVNPLDLLDSPRLWALNQTIKSFDVVLGVAPRITKVPDAVALSALFTNLWLVLHHRHDTRADLQVGLDRLAERGITLAGAMFIHPPAGEVTP